MLTNRRAFTLIEIVVVLSIVAVLFSLTTVAVQHVRESARRLACQNNLHQLGIAITHYADANQGYPTLLGNRRAKGDEAFVQTAFIAILPQLEARPPKFDPYTPTDSPDNYPPPVLRCPSSNDFLGYRYNFGSGLGWLSDWNGLIRVFKGIRPSEVTDGLSNTAMMSEHMSGKDRTRPVAMAVLPNYFTEASFVSDCRNLTNASTLQLDLGLEWQKHRPCDIVYGHFLPPNSPHWDCQGGDINQLLSARSYHSGGVLSVYVDGSVHWISNKIDQEIWRALGTTSGHDGLNPSH